jgi:uncharacterized protein YacL
MYKEGGILMLVGVLLSLGFIILLGWYVNTKISSALNPQQWLTRFVALLLTCLLGLFIVDKLVSWEMQLLSDEMSNGLFELIKNVVLIIFGYQFNASTKQDNNEHNNNNEKNDKEQDNEG